MTKENSLDDVAVHHLIVTYGNRPGLPYSAQIVLLLKELQERRVEVEKYKAWAASCDEPTREHPTTDPATAYRTNCNHPPEARGLTGCLICGALF